MATKPTVGLLVGGREYGGWKAARVQRGIEAVSGSFELSVSERWNGQSEPWPIKEEDECTILINGKPVITGYVDTRDPSGSPTERTLTVAGRDRTGALVDCDAVLGAWEFKTTPLMTLANRVCAPFGVRVSVQPGLVLPPPPAKFVIDPGDTAFEVLERACRGAGVLLVADGLGGLVFTRAGSTRATTALVEGENLLSWSGRFSAMERFHRYVVMGQHAGTDELNGDNAAAVKGEATDGNVRRTERVKLIRAEGNVTKEYAKRRAEWEAAVRTGRAGRVTHKVQGWTQADGTLWPINAIVPVQNPAIGVSGDMLIIAAAHTLDEGGHVTELVLTSPAAFKPEPSLGSSPTSRDPWRIADP